MASLGPFAVHEKAPRQEGGNAYAAAVVTSALQRTEGSSLKLGTAMALLEAPAK